MQKKELLSSGTDQKLILKKVDTLQEFKELRDSWDRLLEETSNPNIFLTWEWLYTWWEFYSAGYQLFILLALDQNENLSGIAPFCLARISPIRIKVLRFLGTEEVCSDHLDFILKKGREKEALALFFKFLEENSKEWDLLEFTDMPEDSFSLPFVQTLAEKNRLSFSSDPWTVCPYVVLPNSWEDLLEVLSRKARKDIKYQLKLLKEHSDVLHSTVENKDEVIPKMEELFFLHGKRWSALGEQGVFQRERFNRFHKKIAQLFFDQGWLLISYLSTKDKIIALYYNFIYSNRVYYYQSGFDPDWKDFSPGTASITLTIQAAISKGIKEFDFLRGEAQYKYKWTEKERKNLKVLVWNKNFRSTIYKNFLSFLTNSKKLIKRYLPDFVIKVLKYLWRKAGFAGE